MMLWKMISSSIWFRRGLYVPMLVTVTITLALIGAVRIVDSSFDTIVDREMQNYGANVILTPRGESMPREQGVAVEVKTTEFKRENVQLAVTDVQALLRLNPAWVVKGEPGVLVGQNLADRLNLTGGETVEIDNYRGKAVILDSGMEFDSFMLVNGKAQHPSMIFIRSDHPENYRGKNAIILKEMVRSRYNFLESIQKLMLYVALISAMASMAAIVNLARLDAGARRSEFGIIKALGAGRRIVRKVILAEFSVVTTISVILGVVTAMVLAGAILFLAANAAPSFNYQMIGYICLTAVAAFGLAAFIYLMEAKKQNVVAEMRGE